MCPSCVPRPSCHVANFISLKPPRQRWGRSHDPPFCRGRSRDFPWPHSPLGDWGPHVSTAHTLHHTLPCGSGAWFQPALMRFCGSEERGPSLLTYFHSFTPCSEPLRGVLCHTQGGKRAESSPWGGESFIEKLGKWLDRQETRDGQRKGRPGGKTRQVKAVRLGALRGGSGVVVACEPRAPTEPG